jgi:hypothetical protein
MNLNFSFAVLGIVDVCWIHLTRKAFLLFVNEEEYFFS